MLNSVSENGFRTDIKNEDKVMQVQKIPNNNAQNNKSFQGKVFVDPDLSYYPCRFVRKHLTTMQEMIAKKPYDLFIKQNHAENTVSIIAQKEKDLGRRKAPRHAVIMDKNLEFYDIAATYAIEEFDKKLASLPPTFKEKTKKFFNKLGKKFLEIMQDE